MTRVWSGSPSFVHALEPLNGATVVGDASGAIEVRTPDVPWGYALMVPVDVPDGDASVVAIRAEADIEVLKGAVGIFLTDPAGRTTQGEVVIREGNGRVGVVVDGSGASQRLCVRSGAEAPAQVILHRVATHVRRRFDITDIIDDVLPAMLRTSGEPALTTIAARLSSSLQRPVSTQDIGALECRRAPIPVPFDRIFDDPTGAVILAETDRLTGLLPTYDASKMDARSGYLGPEYFEKFFRQSTIRVYHLIQQLRDSGLSRGSVLEVGSLCGQFAATLQRLGYEVTALDRYRAYHGAYAGFVSHLRRAGVRIVETDRSDEADLLARLGQFDAVISMAVVEHIPHTPRDFLRTLASHVLPGGLLILDTPNVARYWNRRRLAEGRSIHPAIGDQFYSSIPFEGHHREYTAAELTWMLEQVGCCDVRTRLLDYNLLQFPELWSDHVQALLAITVDPTLADTILVAGRMPAGQPPLSRSMP